MARLLRSVAVLVFVAGCFFPADRGRMLEARVDKLSEDNLKLRDQLKDTEQRLGDTGAQLKTALEQLDAASRSTGANMGVKLDAAIQDVATLRGAMETNQYKLTELESKLAQVQSGPTTGPAVEVKKEEPKKEEKKPDDPKEFLKFADDKAKAGEGDAARKLYQEFLKKWPHDENAGEAHFGLGETYFADSKWREALYEFGKVIQDFGKTKSAASAYLRSADSFKELKMGDESKLALQEVVKQFPKSDAAKTAKTRLAELDKKKKGSK